MFIDLIRSVVEKNENKKSIYCCLPIIKMINRYHNYILESPVLHLGFFVEGAVIPEFKNNRKINR